MGLAARILRIQRGEGRLAALVVCLTLTSMAAHTIGESGIDALFFDRVGAQSLPFVYLLQGGTTFVVMLGLTGFLGRLGPRRAYLGAPFALGALVVVERAIVATDPPWIYFVMWITAGLGLMVLGVFLWGTAGAVVDTRQAKRLFPIFGAGGILGSVVGGLLTRPLASAIGAENLLLVWAGGLGVAFVLARLVLGPAAGTTRRRVVRQAPSALRDMGRVLLYVRRSHLLVWMTAAAVLFSVLFYSLYLPYAQAASERFPDAETLAGFFGLFWAGVTAAAFVVSLLVTNRLFLWFGVATVVIVLPLLYTTAFGVLLIESGFVTLVVLRFVLGTWLQGVASTGWEMLINITPQSRRDQTRAFLNGGPTQIGTVIAGVVALVGREALTLRQFALVGIAAAVLTVVATIGIRRSYATALVDALRAGRPQVFEPPSILETPVTLAMDAESARVLARAIKSTDVHERRVAFQLLAGLPTELRPMDGVSGAGDPDPLVRLAAIRAIDGSSPRGREALVATLGDPDPAVGAAVAARLVGVGDDDESMGRLRALLADPDRGVRLAALWQLGLAPPGLAGALVSGLLADPDAEIRAAALERLAAAAPERCLEPALAGLHDDNPLVRAAAGRAFGRTGGRGLEHVVAALGDPGTSDAAVEAIRRIDLDGDGDRVRAFVRSAAARASRDRDLAAAIPPDQADVRLLRDAVLDRGRRIARSGLWASTLLGSRRSEMGTAIDNLEAGSPGQLANALETLETAGDPKLLRPLLSLWEPLAATVSRGDWLARALDHDDEFIRRCAEFVRARRGGGLMPGSAAALSVIERVMFLRKVPLFADLSPADLERVAQLVKERGYADGEVIAAEGELGEELHIVSAGTIRVIQDRDGSERELARRTSDDVVGEMSLISQEPRIASLIAEGGVRTLRLGHREFESMLRERPSVALAVMRVLARRLAETGRPAPVESP